jgi:guanylate kinase
MDRVNSQQGILIVVSAPSGAGKTTLCRRLVAEEKSAVFSISHTTRKPRGKEVDGVAYHFVDEDEFKKMIENGQFAEWALVFDNYYGTGYDAIEDQLSQGSDVLLDIDVQGARQIRQKYDKAILVFVLPPSIEELHRRLNGRATESEADKMKRLNIAADELAEAPDFDYMIVNDDLEDAYAQLRAVLLAERTRTARQIDFYHDLMVQTNHKKL